MTAFILLSSLWITNLSAQTKDDLTLAGEVMQPEAPEEYHFHFEGSSELYNFTQLLFVAYKKFISSQDMQMCTFYPSCSVYARECLEKKGLLKGGAAAFDRMSRCHPLAAKNYPLHEESGLLYDPVREDQ